MESVGAYRSAVDVYWDALETEFDSLPPHLYAKSRLLRQTLAVRYSSSGEFRDIHRSPESDPVLHQHLWLLDDLEIPNSDERQRVEEHVFRAVVHGLCALHLNEEAEWEGLHIASHALPDWLVRRSASEFAALLSEDVTFWARHHQRWQSYDEAMLFLERDGYEAIDAEIMSLQPARLAPLALGSVAVACWAGRLTQLEPLEVMLDHLGFVRATVRDLVGIKRDLAHGILSPAVRQMMAWSGLAPVANPLPERIVGEILLNGAVEPVIETCHMQLEKAGNLARLQQLPTFASYAEHLDGVIEETRSILTMKGSRRHSRLLIQPAPLTANLCVSMAKRYLLADPTLREAWEVHRWGMHGATELTARFPSGLIIEILGRHGVDVTDLVDGFYRHAENTDFAYYDNPTTPYVDTDNVGVLLRIFQYSDDTPNRRLTLHKLLALLESYVGVDGRLPVWLVNRQGDDLPAVFLGEGCGTIEANLLLGLLRYKPHDLHDLVLPAARRLVADFASRGTSITVNYPRTYTLAVLAELFGELATEGLSSQIRDFVAAEDRVRLEIDRETSRSRIGPQDAACLTWACHTVGIDRHPPDRLLAIILSSQSFDGGWPAEPFFFAPTAGGRVTWYSSRLLTSAICYHALSLVARESG